MFYKYVLYRHSMTQMAIEFFIKMIIEFLIKRTIECLKSSILNLLYGMPSIYVYIYVYIYISDTVLICMTFEKFCSQFCSQ